MDFVVLLRTCRPQHFPFPPLHLHRRYHDYSCVPDDVLREYFYFVFNQSLFRRFEQHFGQHFGQGGMPSDTSTVSVLENPHPWTEGKEILHLKATTDDLWNRMAVVEKTMAGVKRVAEEETKEFEFLRKELADLIEQNRQRAETEWLHLRLEREHVERVAAELRDEMAKMFQDAEIKWHQSMTESMTESMAKSMAQSRQEALSDWRREMALSLQETQSQTGGGRRKSARR
jgi:hypothetical protein